MTSIEILYCPKQPISKRTMRSSNLFLSIVSIVSLTTITIASIFLTITLLDRTIFLHVLGRGWCFGLIIASMSLLTVGTIASGIVYWFGTTADQKELWSAVAQVMGWYLFVLRSAVAGLAAGVEWFINTWHGHAEHAPTQNSNRQGHLSTE
ncbi:protein of unknown function [Taphrina deformans PYCC 5710]|uniref:Uncharacterized protein n=1 Tax=Taphrina deformans (strain PYCC 5710 / ATCC 11124 / CBS 356.35 / IMI 108563 / JCM 9778 / NBRC 8474) TaxID=1097556 RepID=R4XHY1_TAPDE|nr:protein of unknown function [Taphrina deformans PYCC 5710]|eukprot:CCG84114.1 protein of unknown function [Taphrina deformans PYCC 5710]